jgi:putative chitinase
MITELQLKQIAPKCKDTKELVVALNTLLPKYDILTPLRISHFLAQYATETQGFTKFIENTNYTSPERLLAVFPKYFKSKLVAVAYVGKPQEIANRVYANRYGNGDEQSGDGFRYRGRGLCHLTFKSNYYQFSLETNVDCLRHPELLEELHYAVMVGCWYWKRNKINDYADKDDLDGVSDLINIGSKTNRVGDANGYTDRKAYLTACKNIIGV